MNVLRALVGAREQTDSDDDDGEGDDDATPAVVDHGNRKLLKMRCYVCAGSGMLELLERGSSTGRIVRCIACSGTGTLWMERSRS